MTREGTAVAPNVARVYPWDEFPELYVRAPDAWDHEAAPPELDVEGSNIKYRCKTRLFFFKPH